MKVIRANGHSRQDMWRALLAEVDRVGAQEPILRDILEPLAAARSLEWMLAQQLAAVLRTDRAEGQALSDLFAKVLLSDPSIANAVVADFEAVRTRDPACTSFLHALVNYKGFQALQAHRISHKLLHDGRAELAAWLANRVSFALGPDIHPAAKLGRGVLVDHGSGVVIGETAIVEDNVSIMQNVTLGGTGNEVGDRHPKIAQGVMIGSGAKILGNVKVGAMSKVAAGSVVLKDVLPNCTVAGIPAKVVRWHQSEQVPSQSMDQSI